MSNLSLKLEALRLLAPFRVHLRLVDLRSQTMHRHLAHMEPLPPEQLEHLKMTSRSSRAEHEAAALSETWSSCVPNENIPAPCALLNLLRDNRAAPRVHVLEESS